MVQLVDKGHSGLFFCFQFYTELGKALASLFVTVMVPWIPLAPGRPYPTENTTSALPLGQ